MSGPQMDVGWWIEKSCSQQKSLGTDHRDAQNVLPTCSILVFPDPFWYKLVTFLIAAVISQATQNSVGMKSGALLVCFTFFYQCYDCFRCWVGLTPSVFSCILWHSFLLCSIMAENFLFLVSFVLVIVFSLYSFLPYKIVLHSLLVACFSWIFPLRNPLAKLPVDYIHSGKINVFT